MTMPLIAMIGSLLLLFIMGAPLGFTLIVSGAIGLLLGGHPDPLSFVILRVWGGSVSFVLTAVPLFIYMAELVVRNRMMEFTFKGLAAWVSLLPGRLIHVNIWGSAMFAAVSGSSAATCAVISKVTLPELRQRQYPERLVLGTLIGPPTLGILIPPSIVLILYGVMIGESVRLLFIGGVLPGIMLAALFSLYVAVVAKLRYPTLGQYEVYTWRDRLLTLRFMLPILFLIISMLGGMYLGWITPTEAAAWGIFGAIIISIVLKTFRFRDLFTAMLPAVKTTAMVLLIYTGAGVLGTALAYLGGAKAIMNFVGGLDISPLAIIFLLYLVYLVLGMFFDGLSILLITTPIVYELVVTGLGYDGIWLGIVLVILIEIACITPPVGFNLYIVQAATGASIRELIMSMLPFFFIMLVALLLITFWPQIVTFLPTIVAQAG